MRTATKPRAEQGRRQTLSARPNPSLAQSARPRRKSRPRRLPLLPLAIIAASLTSHMTAVAMLNYEYARQASLTREMDRTQLNIDRLRGQIAAHTDEIALRQWAEQAGMVRVDEQPDLTMVGLDAPPTPPSKPVAMGNADL
jgi:hypothetical protein